MAKTLVLVRHGQASFAARDYDALSPLGRRQSILLGRHWRSCGQQFDQVWAGAMVRQRDTAQLACADLPGGTGSALVDPAFNEFDHQNLIRAYLPQILQDHAEFEGDRRTLLADRRTFQRLFELVTAAWVAARASAIPVTESWGQFTSRCQEGLLRIAAGGPQRIVVFTSGGVIASILMRALDIPAETAFRLNWQVLNASMHVFRLGSRGLELQSFNDTAYLQLERDPELLTYR